MDRSGSAPSDEFVISAKLFSRTSLTKCDLDHLGNQRFQRVLTRGDGMAGEEADCKSGNAGGMSHAYMQMRGSAHWG